jgi:hypothetical protein
MPGSASVPLRCSRAGSRPRLVRPGIENPPWVPATCREASSLARPALSCIRQEPALRPRPIQESQWGNSRPFGRWRAGRLVCRQRAGVPLQLQYRGRRGHGKKRGSCSKTSKSPPRRRPSRTLRTAAASSTIPLVQATMTRLASGRCLCCRAAGPPPSGPLRRPRSPPSEAPGASKARNMPGRLNAQASGIERLPGPCLELPGDLPECPPPCGRGEPVGTHPSPGVGPDECPEGIGLTLARRPSSTRPPHRRHGRCRVRQRPPRPVEEPNPVHSPRPPPFPEPPPLRRPPPE